MVAKSLDLDNQGCSSKLLRPYFLPNTHIILHDYCPNTNPSTFLKPKIKRQQKLKKYLAKFFVEGVTADIGFGDLANKVEKKGQRVLEFWIVESVQL